MVIQRKHNQEGLRTLDMSGMILLVSETDLGSMIEDLPGWSNLQVRYLNTYKGIRYYNVHLTKKQVAVLGASKIKATYQATEYKEQESQNDSSQ